MKSPEIIDFHAHAFPDKVAQKAVDNLQNYYGIRTPHNGTLSRLMEICISAGVSKVVLHSTATRPEQVESVNSWIAAQLSDRVIGFGTLHCEYRPCLREIDRIIGLGLKGIKLHPDFQGFAIDSPKMYPIYEALEGRLPVLMHMGDERQDLSSPRRLANVLERFPRLTVVAAHLGGYSCWDEAKSCLAGRDVYVDTSSSLFRLAPDRAADLVRAYGADRVLFGTDYPLFDAEGELKRLGALGLLQDELDKILSLNAKRLLQI